MPANWNKETIVQGRMNQARANETPNSFATLNGESQVNETNSLDTTDPRMAGQEGARAMQLMTDPAEIKRTENWMGAFGMSNQGMMWNQAKMLGGVLPPPDQAP